MAFKRVSTINKAKEYLAMSAQEVQDFCADKKMSDFEAVVLVSKEYGISQKDDIEAKIQDIYNTIVPEAFKVGLSKLSHNVIVAIVIRYFSELLDYVRINNKNTEVRTFDTKMITKGLEYFMTKYNLAEREAREVIAQFCIDIPIEFKEEHRYITSDIALAYQYIQKYEQYSDIMSMAEYKAIFYSKSVVERLANVSERDVNLYVQSYLRMQAQVRVRKLCELGYSDERIAALLLSEREGLLNLSLLNVNIPGTCKDRLKDSKIEVLLKHRIKSLNSIAYSGNADLNSPIVINGKSYTSAQIVKLLKTKLPLAIMNESRTEGIYLNSKNELKIYKPCIKEE